MTKATLRTCPNGHQYYKSSDCLVCPVCEAEKKPKEGFLSRLGAPARRALEREGITSVQRLAGYTEKEILSLHGIGPSSLPVLQLALKEQQLNFKNKKELYE
ncbi:MAG: RNA polymerase alpha subunit C-terminal domain-containing protein [Niabella sp.]|nr:RNA polymerase alpha subunit C-terminal domain-containing protein [Niabella sp.]